jgi:NADH-quinone oxidoreductase subunit M
MALSSMGLPGLNGFVGEFLILLGTFGSDGLSLSISEGGLYQGAILTALCVATVAAFLAVRQLFAWGRAQAAGGPFPFGPVFLGTLVVIGCLGAVVYPPLGPWPGGLLVRPLLPHALSIMPFTLLMPTLSVLATLGVVLGAVYLLVAIERTFLGPVTPTHAAASVGQDLTIKERWLLAPFVLAALGLGLYPAPLMRALEPTMVHYAQQFRDQAGWPKARPPALSPSPGRLVPVGPGHLNPSIRQAP